MTKTMLGKGTEEAGKAGPKGTSCFRSRGRTNHNETNRGRRTGTDGLTGFKPIKG